MKVIFCLAVISLLLTNKESQAQNNRKMLVAYFSQSGNTEEVANQIKKMSGADIFQIIPAKPYPNEYQAIVDQAKKEINEGYQPVLKTQPDDLKQYDVIFVGSPCWWGTIAPPVATFLANNDLAGKTIVPFMTHEGSRMGHSVADIKKLCPNSTVLEGLPIRGSQAKEASRDIMAWLKGMKMIP